MLVGKTVSLPCVFQGFELPQEEESNAAMSVMLPELPERGCFVDGGEDGRGLCEGSSTALGPLS